MPDIQWNDILNETIYPGRPLQNKIFDILARSRQFKFIYSADVTKFFRQIEVLPEDRDKQRIIWRESPQGPLREFRLNTVTYGLICAPYQSNQALRQVAIDNAPDEHTKNIILLGVYVDDLLFGADTIDICRKNIKDIISTLASACMILCKWMSNEPQVLSEIPEDQRISSLLPIDDKAPTIKMLGVVYDPQKDAFSFKVKVFDNIQYTKRGVMSVSASLYDLVGFAIPVIMKFRLLIQQLWMDQLTWDEPIDETTTEAFNKCVQQLPLLAEMEIPRWTGGANDNLPQLIGFSDASQDGIAAVIYSRIKKENEWKVTLIAAKAKVTPLKTQVNLDSKLLTIPKLELEGLVLLTELHQQILTAWDRKTTIRCYVDSEIVVAWMRTAASHLTDKVIDRKILKIKKTIKPSEVHHVAGKLNPADLASSS